MPPKFHLQSLLDLSQSRMDDAAKQLAQLLASEQEGHKRLQLLIDYRAEYERRFMRAAQSGISPREWQNYQSFIAKLDDAIAQQQGMVEVSRNQTSEGQKRWLDQRNKVRAFDTLSDRHQALLLKEQNKGEQKQSDEHAAKHTSKS